MAVNPPASVKTMGESAASWTHHSLSPLQRQWLDSLPLTHHQDTLLLVHASADGPELWRYVYDQRAATASLNAATAAWANVRYVFGGHVHEQTLYYRGATSGLMKFYPQAGVTLPVPWHRQWLATVGSVGQPRDGKSAAMYAMLDTELAQLTFHRVPYNHAAAAAAILNAGLPAFFAERLEMGR
jgi:diadenosine tetraphosphatase ApaH/serine/threonine PP2A family protein phosphatase